MTSNDEKDVFTEEHVAEQIVDADIIEAVKENIQPLQKGRRATALSAIFSTPHSQRETMLARRRAQFRLQVEQALNDEDDDEVLDPLDVYSRFVAWTMESYPQGQSTESGLVELLEEATRALKDREDYKQDPRYLKLWTLYAGYVDRPQVIYAFLLENEIGTELGHFYEEYASCLERSSLFKQADEIYRIGIARKVQYLTHLRDRYSEFQKRMLLAQDHPSAEEQTSTPSQPSTSGPALGQRKVLGETSRSKAVHATAIEQPRQPNARVQIFVDPTGEASVKAEQNVWPELGTRLSRTKENRPEVLRMADGPLKSRASNNVSGSVFNAAPRAFVPFRDTDATTTRVPSSTTPADSTSFPKETTELSFTSKTSFTPFRDEGLNETPVRVETPSMAAPRIKQMGMTTEAEALRKDPFKNYR